MNRQQKSDHLLLGIQAKFVCNYFEVLGNHPKSEHAGQDTQRFYLVYSI